MRTATAWGLGEVKVTEEGEQVEEQRVRVRERKEGSVWTNSSNIVKTLLKLQVFLISYSITKQIGIFMLSYLI